MSRERNIIFFLKWKNSLIAYQGLLYGKNTFLVEVTFKFTGLNEKSIYCFHILSKDFFLHVSMS